MFKKNHVYLLNGIKQVVVMLDKEYACLAPIQLHKKDNGYNIKLSMCGIYGPSMDEIPTPVVLLGKIANKEFVKTD